MMRFGDSRRKATARTSCGTRLKSYATRSELYSFNIKSMKTESLRLKRATLHYMKKRLLKIDRDETLKFYEIKKLVKYDDVSKKYVLWEVS